MRFAAWLSKEDLSDAAFAARCNRSREAIRRWRTGERLPDADDQRLVFDLTGGEVTPNDWIGVGPRFEGEEVAHDAI